MIKHRRPLRFTVPAVIFLVGMAILVSYFLTEYHLQKEQLRRDGERQLRLVATLTAGELEAVFRKGRTGDAEAAIERAAGAQYLKTIALVAGNGSVIAATDPSQEGKEISALLPGLDRQALQEILAGTEIHVIARNGGLRQVGFFPVRMRADPRGFLPRRVTWLVLSTDLTGLAKHRYYQLLTLAIPYSVTLIALCIGLWWMFRRLLLQRIQRLSSATRAVAMGDFSVSPEVGGHDELQELEEDFRQMARRLQDNTDELRFLGQHDRLTGLLNRRGLQEVLERITQQAARLGDRHLLLYLDLDRFRVLNDTQGHAAGDALILTFADLLRETLPEADAIARMGGDEFAIIIPHRGTSSAVERAEALRQAASALRFQWQGQRFHVQMSIGVAAIDGGAQASKVLSDADTACYAAKAKGRDRIQLWRDDEQELLQHHGQMRWVSRIQSAIESDRLELYAQPLRPLQGVENGLHFEVLIRMRDEKGALVPPGEFLPAAERFQLSGRIDRWVIEHAFQQLRNLGPKVREVDTCAINLSGLSLSDETVLAVIREEFAKSRGIHPSQFCFEITETAAIINLNHAMLFIEELRGMDCRIALDDFGSGVSSFGYLKNLPVDIIKIDGMFVRDMLNTPLDRVIVRSINDIAHEMGKRTVAEFAESAEAIAALRRMGVDYAQGYGIAKPMPLAQLLRDALRDTG